MSHKQQFLLSAQARTLSAFVVNGIAKTAPTVSLSRQAQSLPITNYRCAFTWRRLHSSVFGRKLLH